MLVPLDTSAPVAVADVGGKAESLIRLVRCGANVPRGLVLPRSFFEAWIEVVSTFSSWRAAIDLVSTARELRAAELRGLTELCDEAKRRASSLSLDDVQRTRLLELDVLGEGPFAVRSSSPEEDLTTASFAGLYETVLDVRPDGLESAVRHCFVSALDSRVLVYKREKDIASLAPSIAVVVQEQIASTTAGVAFSLNPLTNEYDEVLINATRGMGEALVAGEITPDAIVVDSASGTVVEVRGAKGESDVCLELDQITALTLEVKRIEVEYGLPVDVEWTFCDDELFVVQARPVTTHIPLPPALLTEPGTERHLYLDTYHNDGITMSQPVSPAGGELMFSMVSRLTAFAVDAPVDKAQFARFGLIFAGGRMYADMSLYLHLLGSRKAIARRAEAMEPTIAAALTSNELDQFRLARTPKHLSRLRVFWGVLRMAVRSRRAMTVVLSAMWNRPRFRRQYRDVLAEVDLALRSPIDTEATIDATMGEALETIGNATMESSYPAFMLFYTAMFRLKSIVRGDPEREALGDALLSGYEDDLVVRMGLVLFDLSQALERERFDDLATLEADVRERRLPCSFLELWDQFLHDYGHRGPFEMDLEKPRYADEPGLALEQIANIARSGGSFDPRAMQGSKVQAREAAFERLRAELSPFKARRLERAYADLVEFHGAREYFKYHTTQVYHRIRKLMCHRAHRFVTDGRLADPDDVFVLPFAAIDRAYVDRDVDLRALVAECGAAYRQQCAQVRHFPFMFDSRGRFFRPAVHQADLPDGVMAGAPVSAGVARGPVKVLNDPFEKALEPGDVLVAVTTDPGWTPLFINAAAVILELGGELQHGALVAREYGKPCVSGIFDAVNRLEDGQLVEVDGNAGRVTLIETA